MDSHVNTGVGGFRLSGHANTARGGGGSRKYTNIRGKGGIANLQQELAVYDETRRGEGRMGASHMWRLV